MGLCHIQPVDFYLDNLHVNQRDPITKIESLIDDSYACILLQLIKLANSEVLILLEVQFYLMSLTLSPIFFY